MERDAIAPVYELVSGGAWDALPVMVLEFSRDGALRGANRVFHAMCASAGVRLEQDGWQGLFRPQDVTALRVQLAQGLPFALELAAASHASSTVAWFDCVGTPAQQTMLCVLHDISSGKRAEMAALAQAEQFRLLADHVPALIAYYESSHFRCLFANRQYAQFFGHTPASALGKTVTEIIGTSAAAEIQPYVDQVLREKAPVSYERHLQLPEGERFIEVNLIPHVDAQGQAIAAFVLIVDMTKRVLAVRSVQESEERLAKFMAASDEGMVFHKDGIITDVNPPLLRLSGYTLEDMLGRSNLEFIAADQRPNVMAVAQSRAETAYESAVIHKNGERIPVEFVVRTMQHNGQMQRMTIVRDIRDRLRARERITYLAHHDPLTGLPNRSSFMEKLGDLIVLSRREKTPLALLFIDLDHFKRVNDSLGHVAGDELLATVAARITSGLRISDLVGRFGGDEFVVVLPDVASRQDVEEVARKLLQLIEEPVDIDGRSIGVTPSLGVAMFPEHGGTPEDLIKHADAAMYLAKSRGRANYQFFNEQLAQAAYGAIVMESQLADAVKLGQFELYFQPQVRCQDGAVSGVEALLRWNHPQRGLVGPDEFIPLAEQRRIMLPIGRWVLQEATRWASAARAHGAPGVPVAINLSSMQFHAVEFIDALASALRSAELPGQLLELEITERMLMEDMPQIQRTLQQIRALGIRVSIDDFGTGFSSLSRLKQLSIDRLKIDRVFIKDLPHDKGSVAMAEAIVRMGHSLGLSIVAEGVETEAQAQTLREIGCDEIQGYLIAKPMPAAQIERWLAQRGEPR
jgi:diguanylate cyclase (GGDEF)-like protein/PAS domain S-box-containing protein